MTDRRCTAADSHLTRQTQPQHPGQQARDRRPAPGIAARSWLAAIAFSACLYGIGLKANAAGMARGPDLPLRVAVYDLAPYGSVDAEGLFSGVSVDLWRRVAEDLHLNYRLTAVSQIDAVLTDLEDGQFDAAIGAITITPERLVRVDFSYPAHRSGVAVAFQSRTGPITAVIFYGAVVRQHVSLIAVTVVLLLLTGTLMWGSSDGVSLRPRVWIRQSPPCSTASIGRSSP